jgi:hypothetical protein
VQALVQSSESDRSQDCETSLDSQDDGASSTGSGVKGNAMAGKMGGGVELRHSALGSGSKHALIASLNRQIVSQRFR